jgi:TatD DNase family protein
MLVDSHCHLDHFYYKKDLSSVIRRAKDAKVAFILTNGIDYETNIESLHIAEKYPIVKVALGFYPTDALDREYDEENKKGINNKNSKMSLKDNLELIQKNKDKIIGIGEIGLDMHNGKNLQKQIQDLKLLITLAIKLDKPIILHTRKAEEETLNILDEYNLSPSKVILHCFSGKTSLIKKAIEKGYIFSIPTNVVRSESFQNLVKICPINQILTETDGPYLSPYKNSDNSFNRNEPAFIKESIKTIAKIKNITEKEAEEAVYSNFKRIFEIK